MFIRKWEKFRTNSFLAINYDNVDWSPYSNIESDTEYDENKTFYELTDHNNFIEYVNHSQDKWDLLKLNNKLFVYDNSP